MKKEKENETKIMKRTSTGNRIDPPLVKTSNDTGLVE